MNLPYRDDLPDRVTSLLLPSGDDEDDEKARGSELNRVHFANRNDFVEWKKFSPKTVRRHTIRTATPVHLAILEKKPLSTSNCPVTSTQMRGYQEHEKKIFAGKFEFLTARFDF